MSLLSILLIMMVGFIVLQYVLMACVSVRWWTNKNFRHHLHSRPSKDKPQKHRSR